MRVGIDFGGTKIEAAALDAHGRFFARVREPNPGGYEPALEAVGRVVAQVEAQIGVRARRIGVCGPGSVSPATGLIRNANSTWLNGRRFPEDLETALDRPVRYANDADCLALSEAGRDGAAAGARVVFAAILGTGCGGGLTVDGALIPGRNRMAGEWGHTPLPRPTSEEAEAPPCWCGRTLCLESWLSGGAGWAPTTPRRPRDWTPEAITVWR